VCAESPEFGAFTDDSPGGFGQNILISNREVSNIQEHNIFLGCLLFDS
jgi:hypothetical protein